MRTSIALSVGLCLILSGSAYAVTNEIFGLYNNGYRIQRYDVGANSFLDCGPVLGGKMVTNLAMDNNRRLYYMHPFDASHVLYQADLDSGNQLINQQIHDTFPPGMNIIDGFTIGPDQNLYMTGYGHSQIYRYIVGSNSGTAATEVTLIPGPLGSVGEFRSDLAFDPLTGYLVGIGIVPDGTGRRSLFQIPGNLAMNGVNDNYTWEYFGGNSSPWATVDLGSPTNPSGPLGPNPDGVAFDPTTNALYLSGDGEKFSAWNRSAATLTNYILSGGQDTGMGFDLAYQQAVPEPATWTLLGMGLLGLAAYGWRKWR
ncbi:MAG: PEP-CTERM sorting domain-containing protein [Pirellulales bacterium]|nr:PEP-CTERM sorting domain-containing protein [Pirellulales bacterium]